MTLASPFMAFPPSRRTHGLYKLRDGQDGNENANGLPPGAKPEVGSGGDERKLAEHLPASLLEGGAGFVAAAAATVRTAGARLQFGKRLHAIGRFAADVVVGDGIAHADVHDAYENANANDCQQSTGRGGRPFSASVLPASWALRSRLDRGHHAADGIHADPGRGEYVQPQRHAVGLTHHDLVHLA